MKQLLKYVNRGAVEVVHVPTPSVKEGSILVQTSVSLISAGTERMIVEFTGKNLVQKARNRPDLVREVMEKAQREGVLATWKAVRNRLDQPLTLGYSCAGSVIAVGKNVTEFQVGDRVACAGAGYAVHAEVISVPKQLAVKLSQEVDFESAALTTVGSIALNGLRLAELQLGETVAVIGLGLVGLLTVQLAKASGCRVLGMDPDLDRCHLAEQLGCKAATSTAEQMKSLVFSRSSSVGVDAVIITAATSSNEPVELAGAIARDRAIIVAVGAVGMEIPRKVYYEKELAFRVSRSYGPGRYDPAYEEKGHDYPIGYVRWTENRNMQAFLQMVAEGTVDVKSLITHRFPIDEAPKAYDLITGKIDEPFLGVFITYPEQSELSRRIELRSDVQQRENSAPQRVKLGLLGAGNFATATLLPAIKKVSGIEFVGLCTATGLSARHVGDKFGFGYCTTDENEIFNDPEINTVVVATRHHLHAPQVLAALNVGKHIFCEKPLCLNERELAEIVQSYDALITASCSEDWDHAGERGAQPSVIGRRPLVLMVGFNRRFAPMSQQLQEFLTDVHEPLVMHYRVNAGYVLPDHWIHDPEQGGGRIIGEVCHFVDFLGLLAGAEPVRVRARSLPNDGRYRNDNVVITLEFADGSLGTITYVASGDKAFPKERLEVFGGGAVAVLDNFRSLELMRKGRKRIYKARLRQDKGHRGEWEAFAAAVQNGTPLPISFEEIVATTLTTFRLLDSLHSGQLVEVDIRGFVASALTEKKASSETKGDSAEHDENAVGEDVVDSS